MKKAFLETCEAFGDFFLGALPILLPAFALLGVIVGGLAWIARSAGL